MDERAASPPLENQAESIATTEANATVDSTPPPGAPPPPHAQVTREQLARAIGKDERTIRRWERARLAPALSVGPDGVHRFDLERVRELIEIRERRAPASPDAFDGAMAREAFRLFDEGVHPVDVVKQTAFDPRAVEAMYDKWASLRGGFFVSAEIAAKINSLTWFTGPSLAYRGSAEKLLKCIASMRPKEWCSVCEQQRPELCPECSREMSAKEARRRAAEARARHELQQQEREHQEFLSALEHRLRRKDR